MLLVVGVVIFFSGIEGKGNRFWVETVRDGDEASKVVVVAMLTGSGKAGSAFFLPSVKFKGALRV